MERAVNLPILQMKRLPGMEMIDEGLLEEMEIEQDIKQWATDWGAQIGRSPRLL